MVPTDRDEALAELLDELYLQRDSGKFDPEGVRSHHPDLGDEALALLEAENALASAAEDWRQMAPAETASIAGANAPTGAESTEGSATSPGEDDEPMPETLGRYRLSRRVGRGGMGAVYEALDPQLNRRVAIKVPFFPGSPDRQTRARQRFVRESRAAAIIEHANVCQVYDAGEDAGRPYVVMAYIPGESLADRLKRGRFDDPREAVALIAPTADALAAVHAHGIIHRDIKPGNILLQSTELAGRPAPSPQLTPKLTDFGLARREEDHEALTADGTLVGTPAYMAPEQAGADFGPVSARSDVYSLGAVLYEMLSGRRPYEGTITQMLAQVVSKPVTPLQQRRPDIDLSLQAIVERAMARDPKDRFASATDFADELRRWSAGQSTITRETNRPGSAEGSKGRRPWAWVALAVAGLLVIGVPVLLAVVGVGRWLSGGDALPDANRQKMSVVASDGGNAPIEGELSVSVWKREQRKPDPDNPKELVYFGKALQLRDPKALPLHVGDGLQIEAKVHHRACYVYLVWINTENKVEPLFPWDEDWKLDTKQDIPRRSLTWPEAGPAPLNGGPRGIESLIMLVRDEPLPQNEDLRAYFADIPAQEGLELGSALWTENGSTEVIEISGQDRSAPKASQAVAAKESVHRTHRLLHSKLQKLFPYSRAVSFSNVGDR